jgi:hypothetical protein
MTHRSLGKDQPVTLYEVLTKVRLKHYSPGNQRLSLNYCNNIKGILNVYEFSPLRHRVGVSASALLIVSNPSLEGASLTNCVSQPFRTSIPAVFAFLVKGDMNNDNRACHLETPASRIHEDVTIISESCNN